MALFNKKQIISTPITRKEYRYELNGTQLSFTLRQDNSSELISFKKLLEQALVDCEQDLLTFKK